jgi:hypothetical protein
MDAMKYRLWLLAPLAFAVTTLCQAQDIHKCVAGDSVSYQNLPCGPGQVDAGLLPLPGYADPAQRDGATSPPTDPASFDTPPDGALHVSPPPEVPDTQRAFFFRTSIALGMTDDQVLNVPNWGRPTRIVRTGHRRDFREVWTYDRGGVTRTLAFVRGRLAAIDAGDTLVAIGREGAETLQAYRTARMS